jgi:hypothetical protein
MEPADEDSKVVTESLALGHHEQTIGTLELGNKGEIPPDLISSAVNAAKVVDAASEFVDAAVPLSRPNVDALLLRPDVDGTSLREVSSKDTLLSPTSRQRLIMIAEGNDADRSEVVMVAENNLSNVPVGAESIVVRNFQCTFLEENRVLLDGKLFSEKDYGQLLTEKKSGQKHRNACFYLACAEGIEKKAIAFKRLLSPLANKFSVSGSSFTSTDFSGVTILADTEVFLAFATLVGPICVANRRAKMAVSYSHPGRPGVMRYLHLRMNHFTRLTG